VHRAFRVLCRGVSDQRCLSRRCLSTRWSNLTSASEVPRRSRNRDSARDERIAKGRLLYPDCDDALEHLLRAVQASSMAWTYSRTCAAVASWHEISRNLRGFLNQHHTSLLPLSRKFVCLYFFRFFLPLLRPPSFLFVSPRLFFPLLSSALFFFLQLIRPFLFAYKGHELSRSRSRRLTTRGVFPARLAGLRGDMSPRIVGRLGYRASFSRPSVRRPRDSRSRPFASYLVSAVGF